MQAMFNRCPVFLQSNDSVVKLSKVLKSNNLIMKSGGVFNLVSLFLDDHFLLYLVLHKTNLTD
jgi:hypothetical protein